MVIRTCALICAYNEEETIARAVGRTACFIPTYVIDDGSKDKTMENAKRAGAFVYSHETNRGKGDALKTGFEHFFKTNYEAIITLDADLQHPPEYIPQFIEKLDQNYDAVIGKRDFSTISVPLSRKIGNRLDSKILSKLLGQEIPDPQNGFRAFKKETLEKIIPNLTNSGFPYELELLIKMTKERYKIGWQEIP
ncbi:glycosyltransferase family 2 protein, partial [Candidatus Woesearchaeota archaeon]|nr:glycosyltransferase family 2 protein [Candidatus Woesearchaeota archaeon]